MNISPFNTYNHLKESISSFLETTYKISNDSLFNERAELLRQKGIISQEPFIETTPPFETSSMLRDLTRKNSPILPLGLDELMSFGTSVDEFPLYTHQEKSLLKAFSNQPNLIIATGTGSGKTESFLMPILARILKEAKSNWISPRNNAKAGHYHRSKGWVHSRIHEPRPFAVRSIILYPMNALVNDQVRRLRRILSSQQSETWQISNLNGNLIYFGMYTGDTEVTGYWTNPKKRKQWEKYINDVENTWNMLSNDLKEQGGWPKPNGAEMLNRWDMQEAPPDILVTNYSMLEYMLVRPIESNIFESTRNWLRTDPSAVFTLVLDEAHTYTGAQGTEVAYLIRRLKERLGINNSNKFRCIATSASLPNSSNANTSILDFVSKLFDEDPNSFTLITGSVKTLPNVKYIPNNIELKAFKNFQNDLDLNNFEKAVKNLFQSLNITFNVNIDVRIQLYNFLKNYPLLNKLRNLTARKATEMQGLCTVLWNNVGNIDDQETATGGLLSAGTFAVPQLGPNVTPLISTRVHMMFKGIPGIWACLDPKCSKVESKYKKSNRPVGKLYTEPRIWCECGARVLEVFTCRICGLMYLGGIEDNSESLWPWSDKLDGESQDYENYKIFGVERPNPASVSNFRSFKTTNITTNTDKNKRISYEVPQTANNSNFPCECPRCHNRTTQRREIIEPLKTKGVKAFSVLMEDAFRLQPNLNNNMPNYGRKALAFSDSRQEAAILASDLEINHNKDMFRQVVYRQLFCCETCFGYGKIKVPTSNGSSFQTCQDCNGSGMKNSIIPIPVDKLRERIINYALLSQINPTQDEIDNYFLQVDPFYNPISHITQRFMDSFLRDEIASSEFGLEPLGLACWRIVLPPNNAIQPFDVFNATETIQLVQCIVRILATEDVILPSGNNHLNWPENVEKWERKVIITSSTTLSENCIKFDLNKLKKLGNYLRVIGNNLGRQGRIPQQTSVDNWLKQIETPLFNYLCNLRVLVPEVQGTGYGIPIDRFRLEPITNNLDECTDCGYISESNIFKVCLRCTHSTQLKNISSIKNNFYRRYTLYSRPDAPEIDPYPLKTREHTAQIEKAKAKQYERWFQELFLDTENSNDSRVDILSVTTTMEMGIDIGNLLSVGLRNMPPYVANYQQRSGRAGRRGSGIATVLTFAQNRSHDQYFFKDPRLIISEPPRVPTIYLNNEIITLRHVRALVLQAFFHQWPHTSSIMTQTSNLLGSWGNIITFQKNNGMRDLQRWINSNLTMLVQRSQSIINAYYHTKLNNWIISIANEINTVLNSRPSWDAELLEVLINEGLLPKYAFPIDVVSLWVNKEFLNPNRERGIQRDLSIALSEFAPGAEIVVNKKMYTVSGLYSPFETNINYVPKDRIIECNNCGAIVENMVGSALPNQCSVCGFNDFNANDYIRPKGFCSDWSIPDNGRKYRGGGRERAGYTSYAKLSIGANAFDAGQVSSFSKHLYTLVKEENLHIANKGKNNQGFIICSKCGRNLDNATSSHHYPADMPPFLGIAKGPNAGTRCTGTVTYNVILAHKFISDILMISVKLPNTMDAPLNIPSGKAIWYSFGTLIQIAASIYLQINPDELRVGIRPITLPAPDRRLSGEIYIYDTLPGGSGYAREISNNLSDIFKLALQLSTSCSNKYCEGACYNCLLDYKNQQIHLYLDRNLGGAVLDYVLNSNFPNLSNQRMDKAITYLTPYLNDRCNNLGSNKINGFYLPVIYQNKNTRQKFAILPIHSLSSYPNLNVFSWSGIDIKPVKEFDLSRRPFWVITDILNF